MYFDAKRIQSLQGYASISELIRHALRNILYPSGLTVNRFTPEFENMVLESAKEPAREDLVLKTDKDIESYFINLKPPTRIKRVNGKDSTKR